MYLSECSVTQVPSRQRLKTMIAVGSVSNATMDRGKKFRMARSGDHTHFNMKYFGRSRRTIRLTGGGGYQQCVVSADSAEAHASGALISAVDEDCHTFYPDTAAFQGPPPPFDPSKISSSTIAAPLTYSSWGTPMFIRYLRRANARTYIHSTHGRPLCDASLHSKGHLQLELLVSVPRLVWSSSFIQTVRCEFAVSQFDFGMATSVLTSTLVVLLWALSLTVLVLSPSVGFIPKPSSLQGDEVDDDGTAAAASTANNVLATTPTDTVVAMAAMIAISVLCSVLVVVLHQRHVFVLDTARRAIGGLVVGTGPVASRIRFDDASLNPNATGFMWVVVVVLGAALLDNILSTLLLSCLLASLTLLMPSLLFGLRIKDWQRALVLFK